MLAGSASLLTLSCAFDVLVGSSCGLGMVKFCILVLVQGLWLVVEVQNCGRSVLRSLYKGHGLVQFGLHRCCG